MRHLNESQVKKNGEHLTPEYVKRMFPDPEIVEVAGVLEMISKTPEQQRIYDARLKLQLDEAARLGFAREAGENRDLKKDCKEDALRVCKKAYGQVSKRVNLRQN